MDRCRWEEFLRLISFIFVRLIIQFRLYVVDRFQIITYVHYIYIYVCISIFPRICFARCIPDPTSYVIQPFSYVFTFHTASHSYYSTRDTFLHPRVFYISFHLLNAHTPFYIRISIYYTPPIRAVLIYSQESYTYRVLLISVDAIFIIFFFTLSPLPFFINLRSFFHPCDPISHIQRPSSFCKIPLGRICWNILGSEISQLSWNNKKSPGPKAALIPPALRGCSHPLPLPVFDTIEHLIRWNSGRGSM